MKCREKGGNFLKYAGEEYLDIPRAQLWVQLCPTKAIESIKYIVLRYYQMVVLLGARGGCRYAEMGWEIFSKVRVSIKEIFGGI